MYQRVYETITATIIQQLEQGIRPWHTETPSVAFKIPTNPITGNDYRGINIPLLWHAADDKGFTTNKFATFNQWV